MAIKVALSGFLALLVAMGIGRFAFTPQVPLMIADGQLTLTSAALVAAFNYLGYLLGAYDAMRARRGMEKRLWLGGVDLVVGAAASALDTHAALRFLIGWSSGWAMVLVAAWTNNQLLRLRRPALSAAVFAGPGTGIFASGMLAMLLHYCRVDAATAWLVYGAVAAVLIAFISRNLPRSGTLAHPAQTARVAALSLPLKKLLWSYYLAGFGYILPATFLSQMAAQRFPASAFGQWVWPVFGAASVGAASVGGIVLGILTRHRLSAGRRLALTLWAQGVGVLLMISLPGIGSLIVGALLTGGGFLSVVQLTLECSRRQAPDHLRHMAGLLTCGYALGQLAGPMLSALSSWWTGRLEPALLASMLALAIAGLLVWRQP
ncbi:YbfB/YjiJ family MFS transporter [Candidatus Sodalis endolongispinus]|uniref:YbfB/YjiJ family MFS transporter n=1 Tax=Candidatus Sodalis endolongispinus TaxID=2812662 RepID=A0ABS5Y960_9GAMM|nr:YbfB/YjiJ family MFS transporter [Candidatus Sodalis endolongispinus]MBT9431267.1 YbfB/YjiJ family MFS transporter [Candidatus Sodalis endolongispinus]